MANKHPGTSGLMPVRGSSCGVRPDTDSMTEDTGFDFSAAAQLRDSLQQDAGQEPGQEQRQEKDHRPTPSEHH